MTRCVTIRCRKTDAFARIFWMRYFCWWFILSFLLGRFIHGFWSNKDFGHFLRKKYFVCYYLYFCLNWYRKKLHKVLLWLPKIKGKSSSKIVTLIIARHDCKPSKEKNDINSLCVAHNIPVISDDPVFNEFRFFVKYRENFPLEQLISKFT